MTSQLAEISMHAIEELASLNIDVCSIIIIALISTSGAFGIQGSYRPTFNLEGGPQVQMIFSTTSEFNMFCGISVNVTIITAP